MKFLIGLLSLSLVSYLSAGKINYFKSLIIYPRTQSTLWDEPLIVGLARDIKDRPASKEKMMILIDENPVALVTTNNDGVFSYQVPGTRALIDGNHSISALAFNGGTAVQSVFVTIDSSLINATQSTILYPLSSDAISTQTPTIVGLLSNSGTPIANQNANIMIDGLFYATATTDNNGIFSYTLNSSQTLSEGNHALSVQTQTGPAISDSSALIDLQDPDAPVITDPAPESVITTNTVSILGTTDPNNLVLVYLDDDTYAEIAQADNNGNWIVDFPVAVGNHSVIAQAINAAANVSQYSEPIAFFVSL